ncbi:MAG: hypothetical protein H6738_16905 [Alphaproteobacteria bacterium]|nr:hypothetical protein [Alphaproteobacteria bacterium]MCB9698463.1 hypothetical protein [Alphaproteobacteria bacterium]
MKGLVWMLTLAGCGPDLAKLETEEEALSREVTTLRGDVDEMRQRMEAMGLLKGGPAAGTNLVPTGDADLDDLLEVRITREGTPLEFPPLDAPERRGKTNCGYRFGLDWLETLSDKRLEEAGLGKSSPVMLFHNGKPLEAHAQPQAYEKACKGAYQHMPKFLFFSPDGSVDDVTGNWSLGLADDLPMKRGGDGHDVFWVYPGTTMTVTFQGAWEREWGTPTVTLDARLVYVGTPETPAPQGGSPATVTFAGREESSSQTQLGVQVPIEPPDGPWAIEIASPGDGPFVYVGTLLVGNEEHTRVISMEGG